MNSYQILQISTSATQDDIKKAFRTLAHKHHPDKGGNAEKFKEVNRAYGEINTQEKQREYDRRIGVGEYTRRQTTASTFEEAIKKYAQSKMRGGIYSADGELLKAEYYYNGARWIYGINPNKKR